MALLVLVLFEDIALLGCGIGGAFGVATCRHQHGIGTVVTCRCAITW